MSKQAEEYYQDLLRFLASTTNNGVYKCEVCADQKYIIYWDGSFLEQKPCESCKKLKAV